MRKRKTISEYKVFRKRAIELYQEGKTQLEIAAALGVSQSAVSGWISAYKETGSSHHDYAGIGGSKRRITPEQQSELVDMLLQGAIAHGYESDLWTRKRVGQVIEKSFGIQYGLTAIGDLLKVLGFSLQKPVRKSYKQDAQKVKAWKEERLPALKKRHQQKGM